MTREELEAKFGTVWDTEELVRDFTVTSFAAPYVHVVRKSDGVGGYMQFQHQPRFYVDFVPSEP